MKGKLAWKSVGRSAKRWREAAHGRTPVILLPQPSPSKKGNRRKKVGYEGSAAKG